MKCSYCGQEVNASTSISEDGLLFCDQLHRYMWKQALTSSRGQMIETNDQRSKQALPAADTGMTARKIIFGIIWTIGLWFIVLVLGSAIAGGIAGIQAGYSGGDPSAAGGAAGGQFGENYGALILLIAAVICILGSVYGKLPGTRRKKSA